MRFVAALPILAMLANVAACTKAPPQTRAATATATKPAAQMPEQTGADNQEKKPRIGESAVYLDGKPIAVIRALEMPMGLKAHDVDNGGTISKRYYMGEYLKALGLDISKLKALHAYGGARVALVDHDELVRIQKGLQITFSQNDRGKARLIWAAAKVNTNTTIDMVSAIALYMDKEPPTLQADRRLAFADGKPIDGIPYAPQEMSKGTRVYVDGQIVATVKRKELANDLVIGDDKTNPHFSLTRFLDAAHVDTKGAKAMDFVSNDDVILRMDQKAWDAQKDQFAFTLPRHNQGRVAVPAGKASAAKVTALQIFIKTQPPARTIVPPSADDSVTMDDANATASKGGGGDDEL